MTSQLADTPCCNDRALSRLPAHVVVLMNFVPPHRVPILSELARRVERLTLLLSTPMEPNRTWVAQWGDLDVRLQRTLTWRSSWKHASGFTDDNYVHIPWDTISLLSRLSPDVIISGQLGARSLLSTCYKAWSRRARLVLWVGMSEHTERGRGRTRTGLRRWLLRRCQRVVVNGRSGARYLQKLGVDSSRILLCPYAASVDFYESGSAFRQHNTAQRLLYVGQFIERKGLLPFLQVLRSFAVEHPARRIEFDLIGSGPLESSISQFALPANVRLRLLGNRPYAELPDIYSRCGILAFPTLADDWGMVVNEAMASGMPVLGSRYAQAVEDLCIDGVSGWTYRPDVACEMQSALESALTTSHEELNAMRRAARQRVSNLTPQTAAGVMYNAVEQALASR